MRALLALSVLLISSTLVAWDVTEPDWSENARITPGESRENIYQLDNEKFKEIKRLGYLHALKYPVTVTGLYTPYEPLKTYLESDPNSPLRRIVRQRVRDVAGIYSLDDMYKWLGLPAYPNEDARGIFKIPYPDGTRPEYAMGVTIVDTPQGVGLTFSCAACHSMSLFGKSVMGLTNKRTRANAFFDMAKKTLPFVHERLFAHATGATSAEVGQFVRTRRNLRAVGAKVPQVLGLDTSLPQVALSLARRSDDEYASRDSMYETFPRKNALETHIADSKPMPWWTLKYKTRWLSDGAIVAGNPVFTNFLWNELGRGTDLHELEEWMQENQDTIKELTAAVFSTKAPHWSDFFPPESLNLESAKRGEVLFNNSCQKCHGRYEKAWSLSDADLLDPASKFKTTKVFYHEKTPVKDVGTDPGRYQGTQHFASALNKLAISKWMKTVVRPQKGYVPPPLNGIWARYPYFHNNSIPNLCALLTLPKNRPKVFYQGPADDPQRDFDQDCVGYPVGDKIPEKWKSEADARFDTSKTGLSNTGHAKMLLDDQGREKFSPEQKRDLIMFLKTL